MKKIFSIILITIILLSMLYSCKLNDSTDSTQQNVILSEYYNHDDFYYDYKTNHYKFRLPHYWKGKFIVASSLHREDFYEMNSYEENESGLLFSILEYEDESYKKELDNYTYLCYDERFELHYIMTFPPADDCIEDSKEVFGELKKALPIIKATFKAEL